MIRKLKYKDCITISKMIRSLVDKMGSSELLNLINADVKKNIVIPEDENSVVDHISSVDPVYIKIGISILNQLVAFLEDDVNKWFADLCGCGIDELLEKEIDTPLIIIDELIKSEDAGRFFTQALRLYKMTSGFPEALKKFATK